MRDGLPLAQFTRKYKLLLSIYKSYIRPVQRK